MAATPANQSPPLWFWAIGGLGLLWNALGALAYLRQVYGTESLITDIPETGLRLMEGPPSWVTAAYAIAVWGGSLGSVALLFRKRWAISILLLSLLGILTHVFHTLILSPVDEGSWTLWGISRLMFPLFMGLLLYFLARIARRRLWLR